MSSVSRPEPAASTNRSTAPTVTELRGFSLRLLQETSAVLDRQLDDRRLHRELLNAALQHAACVGAAWFQLQSGGLQADVELLEHPALQHETIRQAVRDQALVAGQQRRELVVPHPAVRNLVQTSVPVLTGRGTDVIVLLSVDHDELRRHHALFAAHCLVQAKTRHTAEFELRQTQQQLQATAALLELTEQLEDSRTLATAQRVLADQLQDFLQCRLVAVGWKRKTGCTCRLTTVSGLSTFDSNSERARRLKTALDEALLRNEFAAWPDDEGTANHQTLGLRQLAEHQQAERALSTPLRCRDGEVVGALVALGGSELSSADARGVLRTVDTPAGTALRAVQKAEGGLVRRTLRSMFSVGRPALILTLAVIATLVAVMFVPQPYRVACSFRCEAIQSHYTVAPFDGLIEETYVRPGDKVAAGQLLAKMDGRELRIELAGVSADSSRADRQRDVHLSKENVADSIIAGLEADRLTKREELIDRRLAQLDLVSQFNGIVLSGSLDRKQNYPVEIGQKLYEVAQLDVVRMDVAVPEEDIDHVRTGMPVTFRPDSSPGTVLHGKVDRIRPRTETVRERNVLIAEVLLNNSDGQFRPGMEGLATIRSDPHPIGWNLFHKPWEYTVSKLW